MKIKTFEGKTSPVLKVSVKPERLASNAGIMIDKEEKSLDGILDNILSSKSLDSFQ